MNGARIRCRRTEGYARAVMLADVLGLTIRSCIRSSLPCVRPLPRLVQQQIIDKINYFDQQHQDAINRLAQITDSSKVIGIIIIIIFVLTTIAISFNTMRLAIYTSREEISVMRLVGAGQGYIRSPFLVEGVMYGFIAGIVTMLLFYPLTWWLGRSTSSFSDGRTS